MHSITLSGLTANLADATSRQSAFADVLAWVNDDDSNTAEDYPGRGWDAESYIPSDADLAEYGEWSRTLDGGCGVAELSPEERELELHSATEAQYWDAVAEYDAAKDAEDAREEVWS